MRRRYISIFSFYNLLLLPTWLCHAGEQRVSFIICMKYSLKYILLTILIIFPFIFLLLMEVADNIGMIWLFFHQIYYLPLSWMSEPFFRTDSDIGFFVLPLGRLITAIFYFLSWLLIYRIIHKFKANLPLESTRKR